MTQPSFLGSLNHVRGLEQHQHERPYEIWLDQEDYYPTDQAKTNIVLQLSHNICIRDARSVGVRNFSIEEQGFQFIEHSMPKDCKISGNTDVNASLAQRTAVLAYINIMGDLLCQKFGGSKAICYDWRVRQPTPKEPVGLTIANPDSTSSRELACYTTETLLLARKCRCSDPRKRCRSPGACR